MMDEAGKAHRRTADTVARARKRFPEDHRFRERELAVLLTDGHFLERAGRIQDATKSLQDMLRVAQKLVADFPGIQLYRHRLAGAHGSLGSLLLKHDEPSKAALREGERPRAEPEYPAERGDDARGWTEVAGVFRAPSAATRAVVELSYQWEPDGRVEWAMPTLAETSPPPPRRVKLATVHLRPVAGKTPDEKCRQFAPAI